MAIKQITPMHQINGYIEAQVKRQEAAIEYRLDSIGEQCVNAARASQGYKNQTGNLRSSTGYVVVRDGRIVRQSDFEAIQGGTDGSKRGKEYAEKLAKNYPKGYALIIVAGMDYAAYVSATGRDVLDSAELLADKLVPQMLKKLGFRK